MTGAESGSSRSEVHNAIACDPLEAGGVDALSCRASDASARMDAPAVETPTVASPAPDATRTHLPSITAAASVWQCAQTTSPAGPPPPAPAAAAVPCPPLALGGDGGRGIGDWCAVARSACPPGRGVALDRLADQIPGVLCQFLLAADGLSYRFPYANARIAAIYGVPAENLAQDASVIQERLHPLDRARFWDSVLESARNLTLWQQQYRLLHPERGEIWVDGRATPERLADGAVLWHGLITDITEQKATAQALARMQDRYRLTLLAVRDGTWDWDLRSGRAFADDRYYEMLGYAPGAFALTFENWIARLHPEDRARAQAAVAAQLATGASFCIEFRMTTASGEWLWIEGRGRVIEWQNNGKPARAVGTHSDISDRKRTEAALLESETRFRALFEQAPVAYQSLDQAGRYLDMNQELCTLLGEDAEALVGTPFAVFCPPDQRDRFGQVFATLLQDNALSANLDLRRRDGQTLTVRLEGRVERESQGSVRRIHCVLFNITEQTALERALAASNADLALFAYAASHDLRQPLRMIAGHLGLIDRRLGATTNPGTDPGLRESLQFARDGARRLDRMISDLLDYARVGRQPEIASPQTGADPLAPLPVPLADAVAEALANLNPDLVEAGAVVSISPALPVVLGSRSELMRLFQNLVANAVKYRHPERAPRIAIDSARADDDDGWRVTVTDNGRGIPEDQRDHVFAVFHRLETDTEASGTGIGLALCRRIMTHHGGHIRAEAAADGGTRMVLHFPPERVPIKLTR